MKLSEEQERALLAAVQLANEGVPGTSLYLAGYAGTGKTTLVSRLPEALGGADRVVFCAFTGKAALQLRRRGCSNATTLHKLMYQPQEKDRTQLRSLKESLQRLQERGLHAEEPEVLRLVAEMKAERKRVMSPSWSWGQTDINPNTRLIVVDECSMLDARLIDDLKKFNIPILFVGDPFQLPPVMNRSPLEDRVPDIMLTAVQRQALDSPVLRAATLLRSEGRLPETDGTAWRYISRRQSCPEDYTDADQLLVGRNQTRTEMNHKIRARKVAAGLIESSSAPVSVNDRVVFLRNDHDEGVYNGTVMTLKQVLWKPEDPFEDPNFVTLSAEDEVDGDSTWAYECWAGLMNGIEIEEAPYKRQVIDFAYALTAHKAQGSEWPSVTVLMESNATDRWLYTAVTRARKACTVIRRES